MKINNINLYNYTNSKSTFCGSMDDHRRTIRTKDGRTRSVRFEKDPREPGVNYMYTSDGHRIPVRYDVRTGTYEKWDPNWPDNRKPGQDDDLPIK